MKKYAIVTGATKGIGRAITKELLCMGYSVVGVARTIADLKQLSQESDYFIGYEADVSKKDEVIQLGNTILKEHGTPQVLVNNAGIFLPGEMHSERDGILEKMIESNLYSAYFLTRCFIESMKKQQSGYIFNMCSVASLQAYPNGGSYAISKFAMLGFSKNLRYELRKDNIKVISIMPGATMSASWEGVEVDSNRLMTPQDIATMVAATLKLSDQAVVEDIVMRPQLGDL